MRRASDPKVAVALALHGGLQHLEAQLHSYLSQSLPPDLVLASDDRPGDGTGRLFRQFAAAARSEPPSGTRWHLMPGPGRGTAANFLHLLGSRRLDSASFVALSDQDDIWLPCKLRSAVRRIAAAGRGPVLLGTRSWQWDAAGNRMTLSRPVPAPLGFSHALVQNFAGGNTMVLNRAALDLVRRALPGLPVPAVHDWWLYQLISGAGGTVILDPAPRLLYRQHPGNQIGANDSAAAKARRFLQMLGGTYRGWMDQNLAALEARQELLTPQSRRLLAGISQGRNRGLLHRLRMLHGTGLHRKGAVNHTALWLAAALRRI